MPPSLGGNWYAGKPIKLGVGPVLRRRLEVCYGIPAGGLGMSRMPVCVAARGSVNNGFWVRRRKNVAHIRGEGHWGTAARFVGGAGGGGGGAPPPKVAPIFGAFPTSTVLPVESFTSHTGSPTCRVIPAAKVTVLVL